MTDLKVLNTYGPGEKPKAKYQVKPLIAKGFTSEASTPLEALLQAQAQLQQEGKWAKSLWFSNPGQDEDWDDPFCDSWQACAQGMVALVTIGAARQCTVVRPTYGKGEEFTGDVLGWVESELPKEAFTWKLADRVGTWEDGPDQKHKQAIYDQATEFLLQGAGQVAVDRFGVQRKRNWSDVPSFNDSGITKREDVLSAFSHAIAIAAKAEVEETITKKVREALSTAMPGLVEVHV